MSNFIERIAKEEVTLFNKIKKAKKFVAQQEDFAEVSVVQVALLREQIRHMENYRVVLIARLEDLRKDFT